MSEDKSEYLSESFDRWDSVMPDIHQAVFSLPSEMGSLTGRVRAETERMYNEALALHDRGLDGSIRQKAVVDSLACVESAFHRATLGGEFNENVFVGQLARELTGKIGEATAIKERSGSEADYELEFERASELLIDIVKEKVGGKWEDLIEKARLQALEDISDET